MLLRTADGRPAILEWWDGHSAHLDLTDPSAKEWLKDRLDFLKSTYGIDGFKFDAGDTQHYRHRPYSLLNASPVELTESWAKVGLEHAFNEFRACWKMGGTPLVQRLSDRLPDWGEQGLASLIPNGLAQGLIGHAFVCPDMIGGGEYLAFRNLADGIDEELFVRSAQVSALFPMMQFSASPARVLPEWARERCLEAVRLHAELVPLILEVASESARTGEPILRPLEWEFPHHGYAAVRDQFLIGDRVLAAPVLEKNAKVRNIVFPRGEWRGAGDVVVSGPCKFELPVTLSSIPFFHRVS
jgi:alpha-glucosidase (family GH31 glycosyl hydrolase)